MHTFGPLVVVEPRTLRPVVGRVATVTDALTGAPVDTFDIDDQPSPVVTGSRGQIGQFRAGEDHALIRVEVTGGDPQFVPALEALTRASEIAETINSGRLSQASLEGTIETGVRTRIFRGDLPPNTNLNQFGDHDHTGTWRIGSTDGHTNGPGVNTSGVLEVIRQPGSFGVLAVVQRITIHSAMWWREAVDYGAGNWGGWQRVATSDDLGSIPAPLSPTTIAYSESSDGETTFVHGDPNHLLENGIASITKTMTVWVARQHLTDAELDDTVTVEQEDMYAGTTIDVGDVISYRDLFYMSMVSSNSNSPRVLARTIGQKIAPGSSNPFGRFVEEMNAEADRLGYEGAHFSRPITAAQMSARYVVDLFRRFLADPQLRTVASALSHDVQIMGGPNPRTFTISHTIDPDGPVPFPEFVAGKTGTAGGRQHVVTAWLHSDGTEHITAILNGLDSIPSHRYRELRKVIEATRHETAEVLGEAAKPGRVSDLVAEAIAEDETVAQAAAAAAGPAVDEYVGTLDLLTPEAGDERYLQPGQVDPVVAAAFDDPESLTGAAAEARVLAVADDRYQPMARTTGLLNIASLFEGADLSASGAAITIIRTGDMVEFTIAAVKFPGTSFMQSRVIPPGFRPPGYTYGSAARGRGPDVAELQVAADGRVRISTYGEGEDLRVTHHWLVTSDFPEPPYPGTPA